MTNLPNPFSTLAATMPVENGGCPGLSDPPVAAADRFVLDVEAFLNDIEPLPAFLGTPRHEYLDAVAMRPIVEVLAGHIR